MVEVSGRRLAYFSWNIAILLLIFIGITRATASAGSFDIWSYINSGYQSNLSDMTVPNSTTVIDQRHADGECCWNGTACIATRPCPAADQDWVRWQFTLGGENSNYDSMYRDQQSTALIHYHATYTNCRNGACANTVVFGSDVIFSRQIVDPACGPAPFGDGAACPSGSGKTSRTNYSGSTVACTGTTNYAWYVVPSGLARGGLAAGVDDLFALPLLPPASTYRFDPRQPAVHVHWIQSYTASTGNCANGTDFEDWWFGSTNPADHRAILATIGGNGVFAGANASNWHDTVVP
jgi:hypothetical protein